MATATTNHTVCLTEEMQHFVNDHIADGRFADGRFKDTNDVLRAAFEALQRQEREYDEKLAALRAAIEEGEASGIAEGDVFARVRQQVGLPAER